MRPCMSSIWISWGLGIFSPCIDGFPGFHLLQVWQITARTPAHHLFGTIPKELEMVDMFSDLPDSLLLLITSLSLMTARYAVQMCLFNKRWKNLWTFLPDLHFDSREFTSEEIFCTFVNTVLSHRETIHIDRFELWCRELGQSHYASIERWIRYAVQYNTRVLRINAYISHIFADCIFNCRSLVELHLSSEVFQLDNMPYPALMINLPKLTILQLEGFEFWLVDKFLANLLSGCPVLEVLSWSICRLGVWPRFYLFCNKLKQLTIAKFPGTLIQSRCENGFMHLYYSRSAEGLARVVNLDLPSPVEANVLFQVNQSQEIENYWGSIFLGLSSVGCLQLCMHVQNLKGFDKMDELVLSSTLANLEHFSMCGLFASDGFYYLSGLLKYMPNLKILTLKQSCEGCPFDKVGVDNWDDPSCIVSTEKMEAWKNEILKCKKLKRVCVAFRNYNEKVRLKVLAFIQCWRNFDNIYMNFAG